MPFMNIDNELFKYAVSNTEITVLPLPIRCYSDPKVVRVYGKTIVTYLNTAFRVSPEHS